MKVAQSNLVKAFRAVRPFAGKQIVPYILFEQKDQSLTLTAVSDYTDCWFKQSIATEDVGEARFCLGVEGLAGILNTAGDDEIEINIEDKTARITFKKRVAEFTLPTYNPDNFPECNLESVTPICEVSAGQLNNALSKVLFAASWNALERRPALTGVLFYGNGKHINLVATDGYRLAETKLIESDWKGQILAPASELRKLKSILSGTIRISASDAAVVFETDEQVMFVRQIAGKFPDYQKVYPDNYCLEIEIDRQAFIKALQSAKVINTVVILKMRGRVIAVQAQSDRGKFEELIYLQSVSSQDEPFKAGFQAKYLLEPLKAVSDEWIRMVFSGELTPALIEVSDYRYVFMPTQINEDALT